MDTTGKTLIFGFYELSEKDASIKKAKKYFEQAGATVTSVDVDPKVQRAMGVSFRDVQIGFSDSQNVTIGLKSTGDMYQVKINGRLIPIKAQDDHVKAIAEIVAAMTKGRAKFQTALAKVKIVLPPAIRTSVPKIIAALSEQIAAVDASIASAKMRLETLQTH